MRTKNPSARAAEPSTRAAEGPPPIVEGPRPSSPFNYVGSTGVTTLTDETVVSGTASVTYQVKAVHPTQRGNPAQFAVNFGMVGGGGFAITSVTEGTGVMKMAA